MTDPRPKVAFVVSTLYQIKFFMVPQLRLLAQDYDVTLYVADDVPGVLESLDLPIKIQIIPIKRQISLWHDGVTLLQLTAMLWRGRFDAVHTVTPKAGLIGTLAGFLSRRPVRIHTFQGEVWATKTGTSRKLFRFLDRLVARLTTHRLVVSRSERDFLRAEGVLRPNQGRVLGSGSIGGVDLERFAPDAKKRTARRDALGYDKDDVVVLFLGRLSADKGVKVLTDAFERLSVDIAKLLVVGPDENEEAAAIRTWFGNRAQVHEFTQTPEDFMIAADILVLPSFREGFGMVALEASAMEIPAVGSDIYGISDAIADGETGLLFRVRDDADLAGKLDTLIADKPLRVKLGKAGRKRATKDFDQKLILNVFKSFYDALNLGKGR